MKAKGRINQYVCDKCGGRTTTIDADEGTTPFMIECRAKRGCDGSATSCFYRVSPHVVPFWEWYRPTPEQTEKLEAKTPGWKEHVANGGLAIRSIRARFKQRRRRH